ncbi:ATP-binding protein [Streptomyces sp. N35]|uniref:ATP-binding protein n=1 Tax=Streptomyces sp. N35 TaxID=2795730 RepID=UPI0018F43F5D|nr:ATP-binding protein [Streptomyces sp. N35]
MSVHVNDHAATDPPHPRCHEATLLTPPVWEHNSRIAVFALLPEPRRVGEVRRAVRELLVCWHVDDETRDTAAVVLSELATNAVVHATASTSISVRITLAADLTIEVRDGSSTLPHSRVQRSDLHETETETESGRGLALASALATRWGVTVHDRGGKSVWARLALPTTRHA